MKATGVAGFELGRRAVSGHRACDAKPHQRESSPAGALRSGRPSRGLGAALGGARRQADASAVALTSWHIACEGCCRRFAACPLWLPGFFWDPKTAGKAIEELIEASVDPHEISVLASDEGGPHRVEVEHRSGIAQGVAIGGTAGALIGALEAAFGSTLTGFGLLPAEHLLAAGPWLAALHGAVAVGGFAGLVGALAGLGFWSHEAKLHAEAIGKGGILIGVPAESTRVAAIRAILERWGASQISVRENQPE